MDCVYLFGSNDAYKLVMKRGMDFLEYANPADTLLKEASKSFSILIKSKYSCTLVNFITGMMCLVFSSASTFLRFSLL